MTLTDTRATRQISAGSWAWIAIPGRRRFKAQVRAVRPDGVDVTDPKNGALRTIRWEYITPANKPRGGQR